MASLKRENERLKDIVTSRCPGNCEDILLSCASQVPSVVADGTSQATALLDQGGFLLVKALQSSQPSFCVTDPQLPDNPIVYASDNFIELTGYERRQVLGRNCRFLQGPDTDPEAVAKIRKGIEEVRRNISGFAILSSFLVWRFSSTFFNRMTALSIPHLYGVLEDHVGCTRRCTHFICKDSVGLRHEGFWSRGTGRVHTV